jgi:hypothetical protein
LFAVAHDVAPYVTIYSVSGTTFTKISDPADLPTGNGTGCAFNFDGSLFAVSHEVSPYVTIYDAEKKSVLATIANAQIPAERENDFKRLILKYKPIHSWAGLLINYT